MNTVPLHHTEWPPNEHGDAIHVTFESDGNGKVVASAHDTLRDCTVTLMLQRWIVDVERNREAIRAYLHRELARRLNSRPMQVGVFRKKPPEVLVPCPGEHDPASAAAQSIH